MTETAIDWGKVYKINKPRHLNLARRMLKSRKSEAEDVVQSAYLRAITYQDSFNPKKSKLESWLTSIVFNEMRKCLKPVKEEPVESEEQESSVPFYETEEYLDYINDEISKVRNESHRYILNAYYILGYTSSDIAVLLKTTPTNVTTVCNRFKIAMKE